MALKPVANVNAGHSNVKLFRNYFIKKKKKAFQKGILKLKAQNLNQKSFS